MTNSSEGKDYSDRDKAKYIHFINKKYERSEAFKTRMEKLDLEPARRKLIMDDIELMSVQLDDLLLNCIKCEVCLEDGYFKCTLNSFFY